MAADNAAPVRLSLSDKEAKALQEMKAAGGSRLSKAEEVCQTTKFLDDEPASGGSTCAKCGEKITGRYTTVEGRSFHKECFACVTCSERIEGTYYKNADGTFKCPSCHVKDAPTCGVCKKLVEGKMTRCGDKVYHLDCFVCSMCFSGLNGNFFNETSGAMMCESCATNTVSACGACARPIFGDKVTAEDTQFHPECFVCATCKKALGGCKYFNKSDGKRLCEDCNSSSHTDVCPVCGEKVKDQYTTAEDKKFHNECFVCTVCKVPLAGKQYFKKDGKHTCETCYRKEKPVSTCAVCNKQIAGEFVTAQGKTYHKDCFRCIFCMVHISGKFHSTDEGPVCTSCKSGPE